MHWPQSALYDGASCSQLEPCGTQRHYDAENNPYPRDADGQLITVEKPGFIEAWAEMEKIYASGRAKAIGVSNFSIKK